MNKDVTFKPLRRSYTITCEKDEKNITEGRCPDYALQWGSHNANFWKNGHDYIQGYKEPIKNEDQK